MNAWRLAMDWACATQAPGRDICGIEAGTAWVGAGDGLLVLDRDGKVRIDTGREFFDSNTLLADG
jgi:hypothetical protein